MSQFFDYEDDLDNSGEMIENFESDGQGNDAVGRGTTPWGGATSTSKTSELEVIDIESDNQEGNDYLEMNIVEDTSSDGACQKMKIISAKKTGCQTKRFGQKRGGAMIKGRGKNLRVRELGRNVKEMDVGDCHISDDESDVTGKTKGKKSGKQHSVGAVDNMG